MDLPSAKHMLVSLRDGGMTDEQIANEIGVSQPTVTRIRNGVHAESKLATWMAIHELFQKHSEHRPRGRRAA